MSSFFLSLFILLLIFSGVSVVFWSLKNGITPMPTSAKTKQMILAHLPPDIEGPIYELGSGWGTLIIPIAHHYPFHPIIGFETSLLPFWFSKGFSHLLNLPNVTLRRQDFFNQPLQKTGLIICYLYPQAMYKLKHKFESELNLGTWIISNTFAIPGWTPSQIIPVNDLYHTKIYMYRR